VPGLQVSTPTGGTPGAPTIVVQGSLSAALGALVGTGTTNTAAAAATVLAVQTLVANAAQLGTAVTLQALIQTIINANAPNTITSTTTQFNVTQNVVENQNQKSQSPN
jgi:hypothetical protein